MAALVGSSNATKAGLGLSPRYGHHELNLWLGCPASSKVAAGLRALARVGAALDDGDLEWVQQQDEDEPTVPELPRAFVDCVVIAGPPHRAQLTLDPDALPESWEVRAPEGKSLLAAEGWRRSGGAGDPIVDLPGDVLPAYLVVRWTTDGDRQQATWTANVDDRSALPPPRS